MARRTTWPLLVQKHRAMHLARQADRLHVGRLELRPADDAADRSHGRPPPIVRVLLAPQRLGVIDGIGLGRLGEDFAARVDRQGLGAGGADVDAEEKRSSLGLLQVRAA